MNLFWKYKLDHLLFWTATVLFYSFVNLNLINDAGLAHYLADIFLRNILLAGICYANIYFFFPILFKPSGYEYYALSILFLIAVYTLLKNAHDTYLYGSVINIAERKQFFFNTYYNFSIALFYLIFSLSLDLSRRWYKQQLQIRKIQMERLNTELTYLKAQMNPHFLFNSINSIFFQIDKSNQQARNSLQLFSDMLRYQLYECSADLIPIEKEKSYLESYVRLQKLRANEAESIEFFSGDNLEAFSIPPLLIIPFVENAFKHGSAANGRQRYISIDLRRVNGSLLLTVSNSYDPDAAHQNITGGIGLKNVKRRLELLFEERHELRIEKNGGIFTVNLALEL